jgi:hypothetical protein
VISGVKKKLAEISESLPPGVEIVSGYDRSGLIDASIDTLKRDLIEEAVIVSLVIVIFLFHFRSALIPILTLPIAVVASFIPMYYLQISSNIMSLGGLALAIGVLVDAAIVMVENGHRHLSEAQHADAGDKTKQRSISSRERRQILLDAAKQVGPALFFSLLIIVVSFLPVFLLEAQEERMFRPLHHAGAAADASVHSRAAAAGIEHSGVAGHAGALSAGVEALPSISKNHRALESCLSGPDVSSGVQAGEPVHASLIRGGFPVHAHGAPRYFDRPGDAAAASAGPSTSLLP